MSPFRLLVPAVAVLVGLAAASSLRAADAPPAVAKPAINTPVTITQDEANWILDNGIVKATISKASSDLTALVFHGINILGGPPVWEQTPELAPQRTATVTIDPATNGGARGEVSVKGVTGGTVTLTPSAPASVTGCDIEIRWALGRGDSGIYTYAIYTHPASYPTTHFGESRVILQLNPTFDWMSVDADRNLLMNIVPDMGSSVVIHAKEQTILTTGTYKNSVDHKYSYNGVMYKLPAYGWSSTKDHMGVYFINPSTEWIGGGAEKLDIVCHNRGALNGMLDYWTSGHYGGGANAHVPAGEYWNKVVGPIFIYCNTLSNPRVPSPSDLDTLQATAGNPTVPPAWTDNATALWQDAIQHAKTEKAQWPFDWVKGVDYPHKNERGSVTGQLVLNDPQAAATKLPHLTVGLAHPNYTTSAGGYALRAGNGDVVTWAHEGNDYQFWNDGAEDGQFTLTNVRPGTYTLHAFADGVLGEYAKANITVEAGKNLDLGKLEWQPVRYGKQVWEIGYPDRTGGKFYKGDGANYWLWGWCLRYGDLFPNDITYTIGKSDYRKDWFFEEVPHALSDAWKNPAAKDPLNQPWGWVALPNGRQDMWSAWGRGRATTWTVKFNMDKASQGQATLRVALAGADGNGGLSVGVNGTNAGTIRTVATNALRYNTDKGMWREYTQAFDAALLKQGENSMTFTVPAGDLCTGVVWDYLRLEINDGSMPMPPPLPSAR